MKTKLLIVLMGLATIFIASSEAAFPVKRNVSTESSTTSSLSSTEGKVVKSESTTVSTAAPAPAPAKSGKSQVVALVLALLVGGLGIHRFYLGYTWQGVVQLLTLGGCGIWSLIDLIRIVTGDLKPKVGKYSKTL